MDIVNSLRALPLLEPLSSFGQVRPVSPQVHGLGDGFFVFTRRTDGLARAVGWAESDYWAERVGNSPFIGEVTPPPPTHERPTPASLGLKTQLEYGAILAHEQVQPHFTVISYTAKYRMTDGAFLFIELEGENRTHYYFGSTKPKKRDAPVAIVFNLPDTMGRFSSPPSAR